MKKLLKYLKEANTLTPTRSIAQIASEAEQDMRSTIGPKYKQKLYGAIPYLDAMYSLNSINDSYGMDSGRSVVAYFLSNVSQWKGEVAKKLKAELKSLSK